ncbi:DUF294 nucleotidyltransferase-like domain-containing protein [Paenibacillus pini]|uniref:Signal-transduction protein n=1 Tax=Paenibacillus pini JCM 16418 TaxID=1236976 RepID=W7Y6G9_9BACL|nr:DUF294 nucleotidyltransferase-like domain-containing protein [Paenibacillus pini]GAF06495.1 signal-transduction protein [Paenibacillus pini JCM 16418]
MKPLETIPYHESLLNIADATTPEQLKKLRIEHNMYLQLRRDEHSVTEWVAMVNDMHDAVYARAVYISEREMVEAGYGLPPVPYTFIVFGSSGRQEAMLWSDQDNGLILSDEPAENKELYFQVFGRRLSNMLGYLGYEKCKGKVMCSEPLWCMSLKQWQHQLATWRCDDGWESIRYLIIASDMRYIAGDRSLSEVWKAAFYRGLDDVPDLPIAVLRNTVRHKATLNLLGQVVTERFGEHAGSFDIKYGVYIPLVNSIRYMALQQGVKESSTFKRLERLTSLDAGNVLLDNCLQAFVTAMNLRTITPFTTNEGMFISSGYLPEAELKKKQISYELRECLSVVRRIHRALQRQLRFVERRRS